MTNEWAWRKKSKATAFPSCIRVRGQFEIKILIVRLISATYYLGVAQIECMHSRDQISISSWQPTLSAILVFHRKQRWVAWQQYLEQILQFWEDKSVIFILFSSSSSALPLAVGTKQGRSGLTSKSKVFSCPTCYSQSRRVHRRAHFWAKTSVDLCNK